MTVILDMNQQNLHHIFIFLASHCHALVSVFQKGFRLGSRKTCATHLGPVCYYWSQSKQSIFQKCRTFLLFATWSKSNSAFLLHQDQSEQCNESFIARKPNPLQTSNRVALMPFGIFGWCWGGGGAVLLTSVIIRSCFTLLLFLPFLTASPINAIQSSVCFCWCAFQRRI